MSARGSATKAKIVRLGVELLSVSGISAISFGELAKRTAISKSGLFAHFSDREDLARCLFDEAERLFIEAVVRPAAQAPAEVRLQHMFQLWIGWASRCGLPGGCPFVAAAAELDDAPGALRDRIADSQRRLLAFLESSVSGAIDAKALLPRVDSRRLATEILGIYLAHHFTRRFLDDPLADSRAFETFEALIAREASTTNLHVMKKRTVSDAQPHR